MELDQARECFNISDTVLRNDQYVSQRLQELQTADMVISIWTETKCPLNDSQAQKQILSDSRRPGASFCIRSGQIHHASLKEKN